MNILKQITESLFGIQVSIVLGLFFSQFLNGVKIMKFVVLMYKYIYTPAPPQFDCIKLFAGSTISVEGNEGYSYETKINSLLSKFLMLCLKR